MTKEMKARLLHAALAVAAVALGVIVDVLTKSHSVWAPIGVALAVNLRALIAQSGPPVTGLALVLGTGLIAVGAHGCYPRPPVNPPSCAQDPTQDWCAGWPPPLMQHTDGGGQ